MYCTIVNRDGYSYCYYYFCYYYFYYLHCVYPFHEFFRKVCEVIVELDGNTTRKM